jgi:hypothetical protein
MANIKKKTSNRNNRNNRNNSNNRTKKVDYETKYKKLKLLFDRTKKQRKEIQKKKTKLIKSISKLNNTIMSQYNAFEDLNLLLGEIFE